MWSKKRNKTSVEKGIEREARERRQGIEHFKADEVMSFGSFFKQIFFKIPQPLCDFQVLWLCVPKKNPLFFHHCSFFVSGDDG